MGRKLLSLILSLCLILALFPGAGFAVGETGSVVSETEFTDVAGHWAQGNIQDAVEAGYVKGYPDGSFKPSRPVSRAEFVSMVNNALQLRSANKVLLNFSDVQEGDWFYDEVAKAGYVRYIKGTSDSTFSPGALITRQEAALMLSRFLPQAGMKGTEVLSTFPDRDHIAAWAEAGVAVTLNKGYMKGYTNGQLMPLGTLTRAEAVTLIGQILAHETIVREDTYVRVSGDILQNKIYVGDIIIAEEVGEGDATLQNLSALSVVYVKGGGANTVEMANSLIIRLVATKEGTQVRVLAADGTTIYTSILFNNNLLVDQEGNGAIPDGDTFEDIVVVQGTVSSEDAQRIAAAIADQIQSGNPVTPQQVTQAVQSVLTNSNTRTDASGTIVVEVPSTPPSTGGGGGGGPRVTGVTIEGEDDYITATVAAIAAPGAATVTYQWQRGETANGTFVNIEGETDNEYEITVEDIGGYLKVSVTGSGSYSGTQTSAAMGPVGFAGGSGSDEDPFQIANWYHLDNMRYQLDQSFILAANLGAEALVDGRSGVSISRREEVEYVSVGYEDVVWDREFGWEPVGTYPMLRSMSGDPVFTASDAEPDSPLFTGSFDGNDKTIKDLNIFSDLGPTAASESSPDAAGLFGTIFMAEIKDLTLMDPYVEGSDYVGALAGYSRESTISNISVEYSLRPADVEASDRLPTISGDSRVGGIVGRNDQAVIEGCSNSVDVYGIQYVGGIAGSNFVEAMIAAMIADPDPEYADPDPEYTATIRLCSNNGYISGYAYVGGIAGGNGYSYEIAEGFYEHGIDTPALIEQCINTGWISSESGMPLYVGIPMKFGGIVGGSTGTISECANEGVVYVEAFAAGGIVGSTNGIVENCYNSGSVDAYDYYGGIVGYAQEATIQFNYNTGDLDSPWPDALIWAPPYEICGYDEGEWSDDYELSSFSANIYLQDMELKSLADASGIDYIGIYDATEEEMRNPLTYKDQIDFCGIDLSEWDFETIWAMNLYDNEGFPFFRWQWSEFSHDPITLEVVMPTASAIVYGEPLNESDIVGGLVTINGEEIDGEFSFIDGSYEPWPEYETVMVLFEPDDEDLYPFAGKIDVTVEKATPTVIATPTASAITYGDSLSESTISGGEMRWHGGMEVSGSFAFADDTEVPDAGAYEADVIFTPGDDLFNDVELTVEVTVNQRTLTLSNFTADDKTYDGSTDATGTGFDDNRIEGDDLEFSYTAAFNSANAGSRTVNYTSISISGGSDQDNYTLASASGSVSDVTISKRSITITADSDSLTYDGTAQTVTGSAITTGTLASGHTYDATVTGSQRYVGSSGNVASGASISDGEDDVTANYDISYTSGTITVVQREITVTADSNSKTYNGTPLTDSGYSVTSGSLAGGDTIGSAPVTGTITNAGSITNSMGSVTVVRGESDVTANYDITRADGTLTVYKANPSVTWPTVNRTLARDQALSSGLFSGGSGTPSGTFTYPTDSFSETGTYDVTLTYTPDDTNNYNTLTCDTEVDVEELIFESIDVTYGSPDIKLNFNLRVNKASTLYSAGDISIMIIKANGDEIEYQPKQIIQPNGGADNFLIRLDAGDAPEAGDTVIVEIRPSGADKIIDAGGYSLTGTLTRSYYPAFAIVDVQSIDRNENGWVDGIKVVFSLPVDDSSLDYLRHWTIGAWDLSGRNEDDFETGDTANDHIVYVYLPEDPQVPYGSSFNVNTDGEWIESADGSQGISNAWNAPVTNVWPD